MSPATQRVYTEIMIEMETKLDGYLHHKRSCEIFRRNGDCSCGLLRARFELYEAVKKLLRATGQVRP